MSRMRSALRCSVLALAIALGATTTAAAAAPEAVTSGVQNVGPGNATLVGTVDANGEQTTYFFEYGKTRTYGSRTPDAAAGRATSRRRVTAPAEGLEANTVYHFRIVARNASGVSSGADRTFRTKRQPLGLQISAAPNPVVFGAATTVVGTLTGTGNANQGVQLQQKAFPFTADWANLGNPVVTDANGAFSIALLPLPVTTQFQVRMVDRPNVVSPVITQAVAARVRTSRSASAVRRNRRVRVYGTVQPAKVGVPFEVQKQTRRGQWVVVRRGLTRASSNPELASFSKRFRVPRTARYRVFVNTPGGDIIAGFGNEFTLRVKRR